MPVSQNGWSANDRSVIASFLIPGTTRKVALRKGDCAVVLLDFLAWFDKNIESIDGGQLDDWGYAEREVRGGSDLSNHASGTGVDVNAPRHPLGKANTFTVTQRAKIRAKLREYGGVIRWGGDYVNRPDDMHFEINRGAREVRVQADRIRRGPVKAPAKAPAKKAPAKKVAPAKAAPRKFRYPLPPASPVFGRGATGTKVKAIQERVGAPVDTGKGEWGPQTDRAFKAWQKRSGFSTKDQDGLYGKDSRAKMIAQGKR